MASFGNAKPVLHSDQPHYARLIQRKTAPCACRTIGGRCGFAPMEHIMVECFGGEGRGMGMGIGWIGMIERDEYQTKRRDLNGGGA